MEKMWSSLFVLHISLNMRNTIIKRILWWTADGEIQDWKIYFMRNMIDSSRTGATLRPSGSRSNKTIDIPIVATAIEPSGPHSLLNYISSLGTELEPIHAMGERPNLTWFTWIHCSELVNLILCSAYFPGQ